MACRPRALLSGILLSVGLESNFAPGLEVSGLKRWKLPNHSSPMDAALEAPNDTEDGPWGGGDRMQSRKTPHESVSVCVPAFNEVPNIAALLDYLKREDERDGSILEVLVEASGSTDGSVGAVSQKAAEWSRVTLLPVGGREGLASALDRLINRSQGQIIVRIDADVAPETGCIARLLKHLDDPSVGIVGPRVIPCETGNGICDLLASTEYGLHHLISLRYPKTTVIQAFKRVPLTIPSDIGSEDVFVQRAVSAAGLRPAYAPETTVKIRPPSRVGEFLRQRVRTIRANRRTSSMLKSRASTQRLGCVVGAARMGLRDRSLTLVGVAGFVGLELFAQAIALVQNSFGSGDSVVVFSPLSTTKKPSWDD